jgi:DUF1680 family protein
VLASVAPDSGAVTYFTPFRGDFRTYLNGSFCCTGSGIENTARYNEGIYFHKDDALWVNLYIPSELNWRETGVSLRQQGDLTRGDPVRFTVVKSGARAVTLNLRIPAWVARPATVRINGKPQRVDAKSSGYIGLRRQWRAGDVIDLTLPAGLRLEHARDDASMVSLFHGPVLLAGELGKDNMPASDVGNKDAFLKIPSAPVPAIVSKSGNPADWLAPVPGEPSAFKFTGAGPANGIVVRPLFDLHHQRYSVYWHLDTAGQYGPAPGAVTLK